MAYTPCTVATNNIAGLDDLPNDVGGLSAEQLKALFDKFGTEFVTWFNATHLAEGNAVTEQLASNTAQLADNVSQTNHFTFNVDVNEAIASANEPRLNIETYTNGTDEIVHPSILFFPNGWNGYKYWMGYTPYDNADGQFENPSIVVSNDNINWITPTGLTNPVEPRPDYVGGYNADICLFMSPNNKTMYMAFKRVVVNKQTCLRSTTDGVNWTPRVVLFENTFEDVSPSVVWDIDHYKMWTIKHEDNPNNLYLRTSPTATGSWSEPTLCTFTLPAGVEMWHLEVRKLGNQFHMLLSSLGGFGDLYFGKSNNALNWEFGEKPIFLSKSSLYKSSMFPMLTPNGIKYGLWYATNSPNYVYYTEIRFDKSKLLSDCNNNVGQAYQNSYPWIFCDTFNRADTILGLGVSDSGHTWVNPYGTDMGIVSKKAYLPSAVNCRAVVDLGVSNFFAEVTLSELTVSGYLMFRFIDINNAWRLGCVSSTLLINRIVGGVTTTYTLPERILSNDRIGVACKGNNITVFKNGIPIYKLVDATHNAATKIGLAADNSIVRFDNLIAKSQ